MLKTFRRDEEGAVSVEFVLVFPVLCLLLLASYVFFDIFKSESTAAKAVYTVSDILSRQEEVDTGFVQDLYVLLDKLEPMASDNKWMRVTSAVFDGTSYNVDWSQVVNPAPGTADVLNTTTALTNGTLPLAILPQVAPNDSVILVEISIPYTPITDVVGIPPMTWTLRNVVRPRFIASVAHTTLAPRATTDPDDGSTEDPSAES